MRAASLVASAIAFVVLAGCGPKQRARALPAPEYELPELPVFDAGAPRATADAGVAPR